MSPTDSSGNGGSPELGDESTDEVHRARVSTVVLENPLWRHNTTEPLSGIGSFIVDHKLHVFTTGQK